MEIVFVNAIIVYIIGVAGTETFGSNAMFKLLFSVFFLLVLIGQADAGEDFAGSVTKVSGDAYVIRTGAQFSLNKGMKIFMTDRIKTGKDGALGIVLEDNTLFSLGPDSELVLSDYVFKPLENRFSLLLRLIKGTFVYLSGTIGKLAPENVTVETPAGVITIRGTRFAVSIDA